MAQDEFTDWSVISSNNITVTGDAAAISIAEGMAPGDVNDAMRAIMAAAASFSPEGGLTRSPAQGTTSGTEFDFTGIPAGTNQITVMFFDVSLSGTDTLVVQIGHAGGISATGYVSSAADTAGVTTSTTSFIMQRQSAAVDSWYGAITLSRENTADAWVAEGGLSSATQNMSMSGGRNLNFELTQVRVGTSGSDTFDVGSLAIMYQ